MILIMHLSLSDIGVKSDFDFCQSTIKQIFHDKHLADQLKSDHGIILRQVDNDLYP